MCTPRPSNGRPSSVIENSPQPKSAPHGTRLAWPARGETSAVTMVAYDLWPAARSDASGSRGLAGRARVVAVFSTFVAWALAPTLPLAALISIFDRIPLGALLLFVPAWLAWEWSRVRPHFDAVARIGLGVAIIAGSALWLFSSGGPTGIVSARNESHRMRRLASPQQRIARRLHRQQHVDGDDIKTDRNDKQMAARLGVRHCIVSNE